MAAPIIPVRLTEAHALHLAEPTGNGYKAVCGRRLTGDTLQVPMPRFPRSRRHVEAYWRRCWEYEVTCHSCDRKAPTL